MPLPIGRELIDYLPHILRERMQPIVAAEEPDFEEAWGKGIIFLDEVFAATATEAGIGRFEKFLQITPKLATTLEERRFIVIAALMAITVITERSMREQLDTLIGADRYDWDLDFRNYRLTISLALKSRNMVGIVTNMLLRVIPANLELVVKIKYNTHDILAGFNHLDLHQYTHDQLRTEEFTHTTYNRYQDLVYTTHAELSAMTYTEVQTHLFDN